MISIQASFLIHSVVEYSLKSFWKNTVTMSRTVTFTHNVYT